MNNLEKMIKFARDKKASEFKTTFTDELASRVSAKLSDMKQSIAKTMFAKEEIEIQEAKERTFTAVHVKYGKIEVKGSSSYDAAKNAAKAWKVKGGKTSGIDVHLHEASGDKEAYQKFFNGMLKKFGVKSADELDDDKKKEFYDEIDAGWEGDNEED